MSSVTTEAQQPIDAKSAFVKWVFGQEANTVALYLILAALGYGGWWTVTVGVPAHLKMIQDGYERLAQKHEDSRKSDREMYKDALDRIERRALRTDN